MKPYIHDEYDDDYGTADGTWHVVPTNDLRVHSCQKDPPCWCNPVYDEEQDLYIHNSADGREAYEGGWRKPH